MILSCDSQVADHPISETKQEAFLTKDGKPVVFDSIPNDLTKKLITAQDQRFAKIEKLTGCVDFYCTNTFGKHKVHRQNSSLTYFIEYDPVTAINSLRHTLDPDKEIGSIKLEANNPEFSIETIPLEDEAGILLTDGVYGFTKYDLSQAKARKVFQVKFDTQWQYEKFIVIRKESKLLVFKRNLKEQKAAVDYYALSDGQLIVSKPVDYKYNRLKYAQTENILSFYHRDGLMVVDALFDETLCEFTSEIYNETFTISHHEGQTNGLLRTKDGFTKYNHSDQGLTALKYKLPKNAFAHQFFKLNKYEGVLYFEKDNNKSESGISRQGLIVFSKKTKKVYNIPLTTDGFANVIGSNKGLVYLKIGETNYTFSPSEI